MIRILGLVLAAGGTAAVGFLMAGNVKRHCAVLRQLITVLTYMRGEIEFSLTPLDVLSQQLSVISAPPLRDIFLDFNRRLQLSPGTSAGTQMRRAAAHFTAELPDDAAKILCELFDALGKQDVQSQLRAINLALSRTQSLLEALETDRAERCRSYRIFGLCTGLAVAVILI